MKMSQILTKRQFLNKKSRDEAKIEQMINWSIFSDLIKYVDGSFVQI